MNNRSLNGDLFTGNGSIIGAAKEGGLTVVFGGAALVASACAMALIKGMKTAFEAVRKEVPPIPGSTF